MWSIQQQAARLGMNWVELSVGAAQVIATRLAMMGVAMTQPTRLVDPEFGLMMAEKAAAVGEAAERLSRHAVRHTGRRTMSRDPARLLSDSLDAATVILSPFHRRVRANVRRLKRKSD